MDVGGGTGSDQILTVITVLLVMVLPWIAVIYFLTISLKGTLMGKVTTPIIGGALRMVNRGAKTATNAATGAAKRAGREAIGNTKLAQQYKMWKGDRSATAQLRASRLYAQRTSMPGVDPTIMRRRNVAFREEQMKDMSVLSLGLAQQMARGGNVRNFANSAAATAEDRFAYQQLEAKGLIDGNGNVGGDVNQRALAANAALSTMFKAKQATPRDVQGLASSLKDAGDEANAEFSSLLRDFAGQNGYSNLAYADVTNGVVNQEAHKPIQKMVNGGLAGKNKDIFKNKPENWDIGVNENRVLTSITNRTNNGNDEAQVLRVIKETMDQNDEEVLTNIATAAGFSNQVDKGNRMHIDNFHNIRASFGSGGATAMPQSWRSGNSGGGSGGGPVPTGPNPGVF